MVNSRPLGFMFVEYTNQFIRWNLSSNSKSSTSLAQYDLALSPMRTNSFSIAAAWHSMYWNLISISLSLQCSISDNVQAGFTIDRHTISFDYVAFIKSDISCTNAGLSECYVYCRLLIAYCQVLQSV